MNTAFVHPSYPRGEGTGAAHSASRIVTGLVERGHDVTVYCTEQPPSGLDVPDGMELVSLDLSGYPYHSGHQLNRALRDRMEEFDAYDLTHSYLMGAIPAMGDVATETSSATVVTLNAYGGVCPKNDLRYLDREPCTSNGLAKCTMCSLATSPGHDEFGTAYRAVSRLGDLKLVREGERKSHDIDGYHALSPHVESTYADFGFPEERITTIPNVLDERFCRPHGSDFEAPYDLLYVGSLDEHKGVDQLVPILARLNRRSSDAFQLTVVGDGGLRSELEAQTRSHGLESAVTFAGRVPNDDLPETYAAHDVFCYPGRWDEPFGRVFLEALATGTPTVASDVGSVGDIVGDGGRITDGTPDGFVDAILDLVRAGELRTVSEAAREKVEEYRAETVVPRFVALYERSFDGSGQDPTSTTS
ncbi:glycosyltransferase family 4 protein [Halococcus sp. IIIV-5B]|uniref:glycosyltransferase family 4 protein n=1 Tax=Halococcus sp. IIIV-5B TaxID=2321230 RepID=UPI001314EF50|nr:glycosyltransferase family 4 protein [Halococcus sp. IIIV-5B]